MSPSESGSPRGFKTVTFYTLTENEYMSWGELKPEEFTTREICILCAFASGLLGLVIGVLIGLML